MINPDKTQQPQTEQLLKLIDSQLAAARGRRMAREGNRTKTGVIGIVVIVVAATVALGLLTVVLEQMRPQSRESAEGVNAKAR